MCEYVIDKDNAYAKNDKGVLMLSMGGFCVPEMVSIRVRMFLWCFTNLKTLLIKRAMHMKDIKRGHILK